MKHDSPAHQIADLKKQLAEARQEIERLSGGSKKKLAEDLFEDIKFGYWEWDFHSENPSIGSVFLNILGYERQEVTSTLWRDRIVDEDLPMALDLFEKHVRSGGKIPFEVSLCFRHKQGHLVHVWGRAKVVRWSKDGQPAFVVGGVADITGLLSRQKYFHENTDRLQLIVEGSEAGIWEMDLSSETIWWSERFLNLLGYEPEEIGSTLNSFVDEILHPDDKEHTLKALNEHLESGVPFKVEYRLRKKEGSYSWFEVSGKASAKESKPRKMAGSLVSIDHRKRLQLELEEQNEMFKEAEKLSNTGVWKYKLDTGEVQWSDEIYRIYERPIGTSLNADMVFQHVDEEKREEVRRRIDQARISRLPYEYETEITTYKGNKKWVKIKGIPASGSEDDNYFLGLVRDINDSKLKQIELTRTQEQLEKQNLIFAEAEEAAKLGSSEYNFESGQVNWSEQVYKIHNLDTSSKPDFQEIVNAYEPVSKKLLEESLKKLREAGEEFDIQVKKKLHPDQLRWMRIKGRPVKNDQGKIIGLRAVIQDIDDLKQREKQLEEHQQLLAEASRIAHIGAWRVDMATGRITWSEEVYQIHEVPPDFDAGNGAQFYTESGRKFIEDGLKHCAETGEGYELETEIITGKGNSKWLKIEAKAVKGAEGQITEIQGFIQDINVRKEKELEVQRQNLEITRQNELLKAAEKAARLGSWEYDGNTGELVWSEVLYDIHDVDPAENPDLNQALDYIDPKVREKVETAFYNALNHKVPYELQLTLNTAKGNRRYAIARTIPVDDKYKVRGILLDITELKEKKNSLREYNRQLEKQQSMLKQAEQMAQLGYWEWDESGEKLKWSEQHRAILEVPSDYDLSLDEAVTKFYKEEDIRNVETYLNRALTEGKDFVFDAQIHTYQGNEKWIRVHGVPRFKGQKIVGAFGTTQDIDVQKKREIDIQETARIVSEQNKRLRDFTHIVSHNLRSHSSNLQTMLNFLEKSQDDPEERETSVSFIRETANSLHETLDHLNHALQVQTETGLEKQIIDLEEMLNNVLVILKGQIKLSGAEVDYHLEVKEIEYVKAYLESILLNLLSNSLKYRHPERTPEIDIRSYTNGEGRMVLEVQDNGLGLDLKRMRKKLFGLYKTFHHNSQARGVGLFLTKQQVVSQGGEIKVDSAVGQGSTFRVIF